eukprot:355265-Chlamydomonas_euryale.AAC.4
MPWAPLRPCRLLGARAQAASPGTLPRRRSAEGSSTAPPRHPRRRWPACGAPSSAPAPAQAAQPAGVHVPPPARKSAPPA